MMNAPVKFELQHWGPISGECTDKMKSPVLVPLSAVNSLAPGRSECDFENVIFNLVLLIGIFRSSHDNALLWMPQDLTDDKSTLVQVMAWCRQATSHCLSQCWLSSLSPYGVARPQWVKFHRPHLQMRFLAGKYSYFDSMLTEIFYEVSKYKLLLFCQPGTKGATSHYLNQWSSSPPLYDVISITMAKYVNPSSAGSIYIYRARTWSLLCFQMS